MNRTIGIFAVLAAGSVAHAQFSYATNGGLYTQDFNSLATAGTVTRPTSSTATAAPAGQSWTNNSTLSGWVASFENAINVGVNPPVGTNGNWIGAAVVSTPTPHLIPTFDTRFIRIDHGTLTTGSTYNYGSVNSSDRALGALNSGGLTTGLRHSFGIRFVNNTPDVLTEFSLRYRGEQWRKGNATSPDVADRLDFSFMITPAAFDITNFRPTVTTGWTDVNALDFNSVVLTGPVAALDGNVNSTMISSTVTGITWNPGQELIVRWSDFDRAGSDDGLAIDDLTFQAVPEPATMTALGLGIAAALRRRKAAKKA